MRIKALKTIVYNGEIIAIGSEAELSNEAVRAFGDEYVEALETPKPEKAEAPEAKEPEKQEEGEDAEPEKAERKKSKKK